MPNGWKIIFNTFILLYVFHFFVFCQIYNLYFIFLYFVLFLYFLSILLVFFFRSFQHKFHVSPFISYIIIFLILEVANSFKLIWMLFPNFSTKRNKIKWFMNGIYFLFIPFLLNLDVYFLFTIQCSQFNVYFWYFVVVLCRMHNAYL